MSKFSRCAVFSLRIAIDLHIFKLTKFELYALDPQKLFP